VVLQGQGSHQHVEQMFGGIPYKVLPHGQNQCPEGKDFQLPAEFHGMYSQGIGDIVGLHPGLPAPGDRELARALELL